jgi:ArsR family transcriptional regulator, virulence genes transcriptional regulator
MAAGRDGQPLTVQREPAVGPVNIEALHDSARRASVLLKAMGNAHRLIVLCQLLDDEKSVGQLERVVGLSQSALSQHLARLRRDGLVTTRRSAQTIYYSLAGEEARAIIQALCTVYRGNDHIASTHLGDRKHAPRSL